MNHFIQIIDYCSELRDEVSPVSTHANELFMSLEERDKMNLQDSIRLCSQLTFDLFINFMEEYTDPLWIHKIKKNINDELSKQKEKEKQNLIDELESKSNDERFVTVQLQNNGIVNWYGNAGKENLERKKSDNYQKQLEDERIEHAKELFYGNEAFIYEQALNGVNVDNLGLPGGNDELNEIEEEGYDYKDNALEEEGYDDNDDDGDYHEN